MARKTGQWDAQRVLFALGRIGYHPVSALLDLVDNAVSAGAKNVGIEVGITSESSGKGRPKAVIDSFTLVDDGTGTVTITQLPHPPSVAAFTDNSAKACRDRYLIGAGNYGFYIYRNGRLISWAESLGMIQQDQDLYSFRGRLEITSDADDILNIDVTKSRIVLSDLAQQQLLPLVEEAKKKSIAAWRCASRKVQEKMGQDPHDTVNAELDKIEKSLEKSDELDESSAPEEDKEKMKQRRKGATEKRQVTSEERDRIAKQGERVFRVDALDNNQLWERAHDPDKGLVVRVNQSHRFVRELLLSESAPPILIQALDVMFFALARGEYNLIYRSDYNPDDVEAIMGEFREEVGEMLSKIVKKVDLSSLAK